MPTALDASVYQLSFEKSIHASLRRIRQSISQPLGNLSNILATICLSNTFLARFEEIRKQNEGQYWLGWSTLFTPPSACLGILDGLTDGCKLPQSRLMVVTL